MVGRMPSIVVIGSFKSSRVRCLFLHRGSKTPKLTASGKARLVLLRNDAVASACVSRLLNTIITILGLSDSR